MSKELYFELNERDRLALTKEQLEEVYVVREAASVGIVQPEKPILAELPPKPDIDFPPVATRYTVTAHYNRPDSSYTRTHTFDLAFATAYKAESFIKLKPFVCELHYAGGEYVYEMHEPERYEVTTRTAVSKEAVKEFDLQMEDYKKAKKSNEDTQREYESECNRIASAVKAVREDWERIQQRYRRLEKLSKDFDEITDILEEAGEGRDINYRRVVLAMLKRHADQDVFDMLNEFKDNIPWEPTWFTSVGLIEDNNPYRKHGCSLR